MALAEKARRRIERESEAEGIARMQKLRYWETVLLDQAFGLEGSNTPPVDERIIEAALLSYGPEDWG